jgi:hypothetical protein
LKVPKQQGRIPDGGWRDHEPAPGWNAVVGLTANYSLTRENQYPGSRLSCANARILMAFGITK